MNSSRTVRLYSYSCYLRRFFRIRTMSNVKTETNDSQWFNRHASRFDTTSEWILHSAKNHISSHHWNKNTCDTHACNILYQCIIQNKPKHCLSRETNTNVEPLQIQRCVSVFWIIKHANSRNKAKYGSSFSWRMLC